HRLVKGRRCRIGGVDIPFEKGLLGHSDADVLLHAVADAVLGALALGDIGVHFPDTDKAFKDADSGELLSRVNKMARKKGYAVTNVDATIMAQAPKIAPYRDRMRKNIARILSVGEDSVSIKATTTEGLGFTGRGEGIAAGAVILLYKTGKAKGKRIA
ncbi:MAG: 2-C-methyl-D-erythritol 2,4-cyclodiphosphate synthase, partial [Chloroflexi bacterium]